MSTRRRRSLQGSENQGEIWREIQEGRADTRPLTSTPFEIVPAVAPGLPRAIPPIRRRPGSIAAMPYFQASNRIGAKGFEPSTSWSQTRRSNQAELRPVTRPFGPSGEVYPKLAGNQSGARFLAHPRPVTPRSASPEDPRRRLHGDGEGGRRRGTSPSSRDRWRSLEAPGLGLSPSARFLWLSP